MGLSIRSKFRLATAALVTALAIAAAIAAALAGATAASAGSCTPGVKTVSGGIERTFCGPGAVSVKLGGRTITLSQGTCARTSSYIAVNIGVFSTATASKSRPDYFGLDVGRVPGSSTPPAGKDGTYRSGIVMTLVYGGRAYTVISGASATLSANRSRGSVTGPTLTKQPMSASFSC
jgi:hypothetical protein